MKSEYTLGSNPVVTTRQLQVTLTGPDYLSLEASAMEAANKFIGDSDLRIIGIYPQNATEQHTSIAGNKEVVISFQQEWGFTFAPKP